jgi:hypothetical protein
VEVRDSCSFVPFRFQLEQSQIFVEDLGQGETEEMDCQTPFSYDLEEGRNFDLGQDLDLEGLDLDPFPFPSAVVVLYEAAIVAAVHLGDKNQEGVFHPDLEEADSFHSHLVEGDLFLDLEGLCIDPEVVGLSAAAAAAVVVVKGHCYKDPVVV